MKRPKPKARIIQFSNKNPGPGREQAEKEAAARRRQLAKENPLPSTEPYCGNSLGRRPVQPAPDMDH